MERVVDPGYGRRELELIECGSKFFCGCNQALGYFVHGGIIAVISKQKHPANRQGVLCFFSMFL